MNVKEPVSVIVCAKNEESRIAACLEGIYANDPSEVILIDGGSNDGTVRLAEEWNGIKIIRSSEGNLTKDRQIGIDNAAYNYIAMIDADHRLDPGQLTRLIDDLQHFGLDIVQGGLVLDGQAGFWVQAEAAAWEVAHNHRPGQRAMIGTAPTLYRRQVFDKVRFDDVITKSIDDTDFFYRLSKFPQFKVGVGVTRIRQRHESNFLSYIKKFLWYGMGDGQFCRKHPTRAASMLFHLLVRYPLIYSVRSFWVGKFIAIPFFVLQGIFRFLGLVFRGLK